MVQIIYCITAVYIYAIFVCCVWNWGRKCLTRIAGLTIWKSPLRNDSHCPYQQLCSQWHLVNLDTFASDYQEKNSNCKVSHYFWWWSMVPNAQWLAMRAVKTKIIDEFRERLLKVRGNLVFRFMGRLGFLC
jgi:hypothetical protein